MQCLFIFFNKVKNNIANTQFLYMTCMRDALSLKMKHVLQKKGT